MLRHAKDVCQKCVALSGSLWLNLALSGSLWLAVRLSLALSGSLWLSLARCPALSSSLWLTLAHSGSLRLSLALYCSPNLLTKPLLGSQGPCSARNAVPEFPHFNQPCQYQKYQKRTRTQVRVSLYNVFWRANMETDSTKSIAFFSFQSDNTLF